MRKARPAERCATCYGTRTNHLGEEGCWCPRCLTKPVEDRCRDFREKAAEKTGRRPAAEMNQVGSPTGRVMADAPDPSVDAAVATDATGHRAILHAALLRAGESGLTSIEAAALLPLTRQGGRQVSNRSASRLQELWEEGRAAMLRDRGVCVLGECHPHAKPRVVHRPSAACSVHGEPLVRDRAARWVAVQAHWQTGTFPMNS